MSCFLLVANTTAQSGKNASRVDRVCRYFEERVIPYKLLPTLPEDQTIAAVQDALDADAYSAVIAMGGDGTFREVGSGLLLSKRRTEVPLAMLPTGTANDQGRTFGLDANDAALERNLEVILAGNETRLDAGKITAFGREGDSVKSSFFFDSAGWGISARVLAVRNADRRAVEAIPIVRELYRDKLVYAGAFLKTFLESYVVDDTFNASIRTDAGDVELDGLTDLVVNATRIYAGAWVFDPTSRHDDGKFEVVPFRGKLDWASKAIVDHEGTPLSEEMLNQIGVEHSKPFPASEIDIAFTVPEKSAALAAQIDGEEFVATPRVKISVLGQALRLIVPA